MEQLSQDLRREFADLKGFSRSNLIYMRAFAEAYPDEEIIQRCDRTIGIILCKSKKKTTVEYALQEMGKPIGIEGLIPNPI